MEVLKTIFLVLAIIGTTLLVIQTIMLFAGMAQGGDLDMDFDGDADGPDSSFHDGDTGLRLFTVRGLVAFFAIGGWLGYGIVDSLHPALSILFAVLAGFAGLMIVAVIFWLTLKLQSDGTVSLSNGIGKIGKIYLAVGANNSKVGKITVEVEGRLSEYDAVTDGDQMLKVGQAARITGMRSDNIYVVEALNPAAEKVAEQAAEPTQA